MYNKKSTNNNSYNNINCNNSNNSNSNNFEILFYKVFKNSVIRKTILYYCFLYKINRSIGFHSLNSLLSYPESNYISSLEINWNYFGEFIGHNVLPPNVRTLVFNSTIGTTITSTERLPSTITSLKFNCKISVPLRGLIPSSVQYLTFGSSSEIVEFESWLLPNSITYIRFDSYRFDEPLKCLPMNLKYIKLPEMLNHPINIIDSNDMDSIDQNVEDKSSYLPETLETLILGGSFNKAINSFTKLKSCSKIIFGENFNKPIDSLVNLPLTHLEFGVKFNQPIQSVLPITLTTLHLGHSLVFTQKINRESIPLSVTSLSIFDNSNFTYDSSTIVIRNKLNKRSIPVDQLISNITNNNKINESIAYITYLFKKYIYK